MRNLLIFMLLVAVFVLGNRSCNGFNFFNPGIRGTGPIKTETRSITDFQGIDLQTSGDVEVTVGDHFALELEGQENILAIYKTELRDGMLRIYTDENFSTKNEVKIRVTAPAYNAFYLGGSGSISVLNYLRADNLRMDVGGSGTITAMETELVSVKAGISGSGTIEFGGKAESLDAHVSGSGNIKAKSMIVNALIASISGSGNISAEVQRELKASISGSGNINYTGSPVVTESVSGSGAVTKTGGAAM